MSSLAPIYSFVFTPFLAVGAGNSFRGASLTRCLSSWASVVGVVSAVGKSTLFNALLQKATAEAANFPFCTIEPNTGIVSVPDTRLDVRESSLTLFGVCLGFGIDPGEVTGERSGIGLVVVSMLQRDVVCKGSSPALTLGSETVAKISESVKVVPATMEFVDIAGIVKGASEGAGLGNKFLANIRECDAIVSVVFGVGVWGTLDTLMVTTHAALRTSYTLHTQQPRRKPKAEG